jgi:acyl-CoA thioesterase 8
MDSNKSTPSFDPETAEKAIELEEIDRNLYRSIRLWKPSGGRGTFGGQVSWPLLSLVLARSSQS